MTQKAQATTALQMNTLAEANKAMEEAAVAERGDNKTSGAKEEKTGQAEKAAESGTNGEKAQDGVSGTGSQTGDSSKTLTLMRSSADSLKKSADALGNASLYEKKKFKDEECAAQCGGEDKRC